jgi:GH25 family lysozyme M1 (1,4-beta-N-acetylmuramidase)
MIKGIDISHWNRVKDFFEVKASGIDFVILKAGGSDAGFYSDPQFENYYRQAKLAGLSVGAYYFTGRNFYGPTAGEEDAKRFARIIRDKTFEYPVYVDIEMTSPSANKMEEATAAAIAFCRYMESLKYFTGIYASDISGFKESLEYNRLADFTTWVARYGKKPEFIKYPGIWQYSSNGSVPGIKGNVDLDRTEVNYPFIIKKGQFNGY